MANREHLKILSQGVGVWNRWRDQHRRIRPDLRAAALSDTLRRRFAKAAATADFRGINFDRAILYDAVLRGADLRRATLRRTDLRGADLRRADLHRADLTDARLYTANLTLAKLRGAILRGAGFWETVLARTDFTGAAGLRVCRHGGPSVIDHRTLTKSGKLPKEFLVGCGLPDAHIRFLTRLVRSNADFYSVFISYTSVDEDFAHHLHADLQAQGVRCWFAPEHMKIGDEIEDALDRSIRLRDKLLLILSGHSLQSAWVEEEVKTALQEERSGRTRVLFPIRLDDAVMDSTEPWVQKVKRRHIGDFTDWKDHDSYQKAFDRLLRDLKAAPSAQETEA